MYTFRINKKIGLNKSFNAVFKYFKHIFIFRNLYMLIIFLKKLVLDVCLANELHQGNLHVSDLLGTVYALSTCLR